MQHTVPLKASMGPTIARSVRCLESVVGSTAADVDSNGRTEMILVGRLMLLGAGAVAGLAEGVDRKRV